MIDQALLEILACPETKEEVRLASSSVVEGVNRKIKSGMLVNRGGVKVTEIIDGGLVRSDGKVLYPIRKEIPIMLIDEAIPISEDMETS